MEHLTDEEYLDRENIDFYFSMLADELKESGLGKHRILVVGGAAMALKFRDGRSTVDIDVCFREQNNLYSCCKQIAGKYNLPSDWVNTDVMHSDSFSFALFEKAELYRNYAGILEVYVACDIDLYCMKIVSFRPKDVQDMEVLADSLRKKTTSLADISKNFIRLYGNEYYLRNDERKLRLVRLQLG